MTFILKNPPKDAATLLPKVYLAGPDVFYPDVQERYENLRNLCARWGLQAVTPFDGGMGSIEDCMARGMSKAEIAQEIYLANIKHVQSCDAVLANMNAFRSPVEPDSGTVFEVGMAVALGKPVVAYLAEPTISMLERLKDHSQKLAHTTLDTLSGATIEDFDQPLNLMIAQSCSLHDCPRDAVHELHKIFYAQPKPGNRPEGPRLRP